MLSHCQINLRPTYYYCGCPCDPSFPEFDYTKIYKQLVHGSSQITIVFFINTHFLISQNKRSPKKKIVLSQDGAVVSPQIFCLFSQGLVSSRVDQKSLTWEDG